MIPRYTRTRMASIWSDQHRLELMLEIEVLVCEALARRGRIPPEAAAEIRAKARVDADRVAQIEAVVHHDVIAFVTAAAESVGSSGRYLHFGMTSSDVLDTAFALQLVEASRHLEEGLEDLMAAVKKQALAHRETVMAGRTHGVHAEPITFGLKLANWYAELLRDRARIRHARHEVSVGTLSGAVGTYAVNGPDIEAEVLAHLGLTPEPVATQVVPRDRHAVFFSTLAVIAGSVERIATEIRHLQRTELLEALEPFGKGQKGSSAMPHKRNPILTENLCGLARLMRSYAMAAFEDIALWHERDISHSSVERVIGPDACIALDFMLARLESVVSGLEVRAEAMRRNLALTRGRLASERVLLALVEAGVAREKAYQWVQRCALTEGDFGENVRADADICAHLNAQQLSEQLDYRHGLRYVDEIMQRVLREES
jgi:adenylosuccinate lyase